MKKTTNNNQKNKKSQIQKKKEIIENTLEYNEHPPLNDKVVRSGGFVVARVR